MFQAPTPTLGGMGYGELREKYGQPTSITPTGGGNLNITLQGAITVTELDELIMQIRNKIKEQPNFFSKETLQNMLNTLQKDDESKKKLATTIRPEM
jgi:hypothetical protein